MRNDTAATARTGGAVAGFRARVGSLAAARRGPLGLPEMFALATAALLLLAAVLSYLFLLVPQRSRAQSLEAERDGLQKQLQATQTTLGQNKDTRTRVEEILTSLDRFEVENLGQSSSGVKTVIEELNRLIIKNNLRISGGVNYTQLQEAAPGSEQPGGPRRPAQGGEENAQRIVQSVFPGIGVTLTVEGTYPNLRRFIRDIEADRQFVVINTVELEGLTDTGGPSSPAPVAEGEGAAAGQPSTPSRGALVSLRLDLAAYFRRASASATAPE